jgi:hypothetical protein
MSSGEAWWIDPHRLGGLRRRGRTRRGLVWTLAEMVILAAALFVLFVIVQHYRYDWWSYNIRSEDSAKRAVGRYAASQAAGQDTPQSTAINKSSVLLPNVLAYQYIGTLSRELVRAAVVEYHQQAPPMSLAESVLNLDTYDRYLVQLEHMWGGRQAPVVSSTRSVKNMYDYRYVFAYDLTMANRFGNRVFKQFLFEVQPTFSDNPAFIITAISERR